MVLKALKREKSAINAAVSDGLRQHGADLNYWVTSGNQINDNGHKLLSLVNIAKAMKGENGRSYFGHGSWDEYLRQEHGIDSLNRKNMPPERLNHYIGVQLKRLIGEEKPVNANAWQLGRTPVAPGGLSLKNLYALANQRLGENGLPFFGCGTWESYIKNFHGVENAEKKIVKVKRGVKFSNLYIIETIKSMLEAGLPAEENFLRNNSTRISSNHTAMGLVSLASHRKVNGKSYLGFGNWLELARSIAPEAVEKYFLAKKPRPRNIQEESLRIDRAKRAAFSRHAVTLFKEKGETPTFPIVIKRPTLGKTAVENGNVVPVADAREEVLKNEEQKTSASNRMAERERVLHRSLANVLDERELSVVFLLFFSYLPLPQVARVMNIKVSEVQRLRRSALTKLRQDKSLAKVVFAER